MTKRTRQEELEIDVASAVVATGAAAASVIGTMASVSNLKYFDEGGPAVGVMFPAIVTGLVAFAGVKFMCKTPKRVQKLLVFAATAALAFGAYEGTKYAVGKQCDINQKYLQQTAITAPAVDTVKAPPADTAALIPVQPISIFSQPN